MRGSFRDLKVWQLGIHLIVDIYDLTKNYPKEEMYGLVSQMKRAAVSIPSNIAEGNERHSNKDFSHFLSIALGSCVELETHLEASNLLGFITADQKGNCLEKILEIKRMIWGLQQSLQ